jgi:hypothetical protein
MTNTPEAPDDKANVFHLPVLQDRPEPTASTLNIFPTGKPHVSYSEVKMWHQCSWSHKLKYIDGIDENSASVHTSFGKCIHDACESFTKTKFMDIEKAKQAIRDVWIAEDFENKTNGKEKVASWLLSAERILTELPGWMDENFPGWEAVSSEELLLESIEKHPELLLKGFVDIIIKTPKPSKDPTKPVKWQIWVLDYKTCSYYWLKDKVADPNMYNQIVLYKHFWCLKHGVDPKEVRTAFILLRRTVPKKSTGSIKLQPIASGPVTMERAVKWLTDMIFTIKRKFYVKNRFSCKYCPYKETEHCP